MSLKLFEKFNPEIKVKLDEELESVKCSIDMNQKEKKSIC